MNAHSKKRWFSIIKLAVIGGSLGFFLLTVLQLDNNWQNLTSRIPKLTPSGHVVLSLFGAVVAVTFIQEIAPLRCAHIKSSFNYPSIYIAAALSVIGLWITTFTVTRCLFEKHSCLNYTKCDWAIAISLLVLLIVFVVGINDWKLSRKPLKERGGSKAGTGEVSKDTIRQWIAKEDPISTFDEDLMGVGEIAHRVHSKLKSNERETIGIVGAFGTGKSSIINLVKNIESDSIESPRLLFCVVSCWHLRDSDTAIRQILRSSLVELNKEVDVVAIRSIPDSYVQAISGISGNASGLLSALMQPGNADEQLHLLSPVLLAIGARLVIVIEDLDRVETEDFNDQHLQGMLLRLRGVDGVSFVLTGASGD